MFRFGFSLDLCFTFWSHDLKFFNFIVHVLTVWIFDLAFSLISCHGVSISLILLFVRVMMFFNPRAADFFAPSVASCLASFSTSRFATRIEARRLSAYPMSGRSLRPASYGCKLFTCHLPSSFWHAFHTSHCGSMGIVHHRCT